MEYTAMKCKSCKKEFVVVTEDHEANKREGKYTSCCYCGSKRIIKEKETDSIKECMKERSYFRNKNGAIQQR
ncbi:hypothetical protein [Clostridium sp. YIM B02551]|uniref:hypothetical protein n=1 Tax=Clostridium sp. YIM B02551 TaxID=2910679 RepID=UPI001EEB459A|nr:hypothetical protein [Clostridium sp. YIM B02551]